MSISIQTCHANLKGGPRHRLRCSTREWRKECACLRRWRGPFRRSSVRVNSSRSTRIEQEPEKWGNPIDILGQLGVPLLGAGEASDVSPAPAVLAVTPERLHRMSIDKCYDANSLRPTCKKEALHQSSYANPAAAARSATTSNAGASSFDRLRMRATFNRLKELSRIVTRYDKFARNRASTPNHTSVNNS